ncbi:MAG: glycoside hydrolase family 13 protein [Candidatus Planktophila sp.]
MPSSKSKQSISNSLVELPHHDGSEIYVSNSAPTLGEKITLRVRIPRAYTFAKAFVRIYEDGEPRSYELKLDKKNSVESWWRVKVEIVNVKTAYRFVFISEEKYDWLNARGLSDHDVHSNDDFKIVALPEYPRWIRSSVFYQIFPDRFAKSDLVREIPDWAVPREWDQAPRGRDKTTGVELFGGDLKGVEEHLDHLNALGINGIYFTPFFPARSNHRYDASSFDHVDPLLGGNDALFSLVKRARKSKIAIMGDLTSNHCGAGHPWLAKAKRDKNSKERGYFYWDKSVKHGYVGWWGHASLPKLNFNSKALRKEMYEGKKSIVRKWLSPQFGMAGWRIDVGNMTGRLGNDDLHDEVMHGIRKAMDETNPKAWLVAENGDFFASDLDGFGWHGAMNYQGFMRPLWNWINQNSTIGGGFQGLPFAMPRITGSQMVESMKSFTASIPWRSLVSSMVLLDSHDTARMRTVVAGDSDRHLSAMALLMTYPGVPSIYAGDEIGLEGAWGEDGRRPMPWGKKEAWDNAFFTQVSQLVRMRKSSDALANGGLRWVEVDDDYILFLRESKRQKVLVFISRTGVNKSIDLAPLGLSVGSTLFGSQAAGRNITISSKTATQGIWIVK